MLQLDKDSSFPLAIALTSITLPAASGGAIPVNVQLPPTRLVVPVKTPFLNTLIMVETVSVDVPLTEVLPTAIGVFKVGQLVLAKQLD